MASPFGQLVLLVMVYSVRGQSSGALRLVGHSSQFPASGRLEIFLNFQWGTVCSSGNTFTQLTADVACRQLGFSSALSWGRVSSEGFIEGTGPVAIGNVKCSSRSATRLTSCVYTSNPGCSHSYDLALKCRHTGDRIRLVSWSGRSDNISAGRLEVYKNYEWGTICYNNGFDYKAATVACRQLGFSDYVDYGSTAGFNVPSGSSSVPFWLSGLSCSSSESDLFSCPVHSTSYYTCTHSIDDVALSCRGTGALRLVDDSSWWSDKLPSGGRLEIYLNGKWGTIDSAGVGVNVASLACRQLGFSGYLQFGSVNSLGYSPATSLTPSWLHDVSCYRDSYQRTLLDCYSSVNAETYSGYYYHNNDLALVCESPTSTAPAHSYDSSGPSIQFIFLVTLGSLCICSCTVVVFSMVCVCTVYARLKKRRSRLHVQRNVVQETFDDPSGYSEGFISRPPPPPYSAIDIHASGQEERIAQRDQVLPSSMQPVVNFSENGGIEHEIYYPTIAVQLPESSAGQSHLETLGSDTTSDLERNASNTEDNFYSENHHLLS